jgi:hypothetical protein
MGTITSIILLIVIYMISTKLSDYTTLGRYQWFDRLQERLIEKYHNREGLIMGLFNWKGLHCDSCHSFWISLIPFTFIYSSPINILMALAIYQLNKTK